MNSNNMNICQPWRFETSSIPYLTDKPADSNSWDDAVHKISIFGTDNFLEIDTNNVTTSLYRIGFFIRNRNFNDRTKKDISYILEFVQAAWNLILFIYKAEWDIPTVNGNNKTFRQYILAQFIPKNSKKNIIKGKVSDKLDNALNISRVPPSISPRPSKKVLEKSKFYKSKEKQNDKQEKMKS